MRSPRWWAVHHEPAPQVVKGARWRAHLSEDFRSPGGCVSAAEAVQAVLVPARVHDVFNPRVGFAEGGSPSWVSDAGRLLSDEERDTVDRACAAIHQAWRAEAAVVLLEALPVDVQPSAFAAALLNFWGVGDKQLHTGLLVLLLSKQRRLEMRVGYGAARALPSTTLRAIQDEHMVARLRTGAVGRALEFGLTRVLGSLDELAPRHWKRQTPAAPRDRDERNRHGFGGGQTSIEEFLPKKAVDGRGAQPLG